MTGLNGAAGQPLYAQVKAFIAERIDSGAWPAEHRVPSEHELVRDFGVSRMTVNRALRELSAEGRLRRVQGVGTFVAAPKAQSTMLEIRNIAAEIRGRGHHHEAEVRFNRAEAAKGRLARRLGLPEGARVFHLRVLHRENGLAVQIEDRYVNPAVAPDFLAQDFRRATASEYLLEIIQPDEVEHLVEAVVADARARHLLDLGAHEPCLALERRTWAGGAVVTVVRFVHPGSRFRLAGTFAFRSRA